MSPQVTWRVLFNKTHKVHYLFHLSGGWVKYFIMLKELCLFRLLIQWYFLNVYVFKNCFVTLISSDWHRVTGGTPGATGIRRDDRHPYTPGAFENLGHWLRLNSGVSAHWTFRPWPLHPSTPPPTPCTRVTPFLRTRSQVLAALEGTRCLRHWPAVRFPPYPPERLARTPTPTTTHSRSGGRTSLWTGRWTRDDDARHAQDCGARPGRADKIT